MSAAMKLLDINKLNKMRSDKELIQIVIESLKQYEKKGWNNHGICAEIGKLFLGDFITWKEFGRLSFLIKSNKPTKTNEFKEFTESAYWIGEDFWWDPMSFFKNTIEIRIDYLEKLKTLV